MAALSAAKIIATKIKDRSGLPDKKSGATMEDVDRWAEDARQQGYTVKGKGWYRYKVRKHEDGRDMTRTEVKQQLIARTRGVPAHDAETSVCSLRR